MRRFEILEIRGFSDLEDYEFGNLWS